MSKKRVFALIIFLALSITLVSEIVSAQSIWDNIKNTFSDPSSIGISNLSESPSFAKFLLFLLITLIVFAIMEFVPFIESKGWLAFFISVIIGILSSLYLKSEEVYTILLSYSTFGIVLTSIVPFLLLAVISKKLIDKGYSIFGKILWVVLGVVIVMKWLTATEIGAFGKVVYPVTLVLVLAMVIWENRIYYLIFKRQVREFKDTAKRENLANMEADLQSLGRRIRDSTSQEVTNQLIEEHNKLAAKYRKAGGAWNNWGG